MVVFKWCFRRRFVCCVLLCLVLVLGGSTRKQEGTFFVKAFVLSTPTTAKHKHNSCSSRIILFDSLFDKDAVIDDDDISQHAIMADAMTQDKNIQNTTTATPTSSGGYRPIEDWHHSNRNPSHVIDSLKRDQAHWKGKFEDLGGDGI